MSSTLTGEAGRRARCGRKTVSSALKPRGHVNCSKSQGFGVRRRLYLRALTTVVVNYLLRSVFSDKYEPVYSPSYPQFLAQ